MRFPWLDLKPKYLEQINTSQESEVNYLEEEVSLAWKNAIRYLHVWYVAKQDLSISFSLALFPSFVSRL